MKISSRSAKSVQRFIHDKLLLTVIGVTSLSSAVSAAVSPVRITELMYKPTGGDGFEFVELHNPGSTAADLSGMSLSGVTYTFPANSSIATGGYYLVGSSISQEALKGRYPGVTFHGFYSGKLANDGEAITLLDGQGAIIDSVSYKDSWYWAELADGGGYSLELADLQFDSGDSSNWRSSRVVHGSPGSFTPRELPAVRINEILAINVAGPTRNGTRAGYYEIHNAGISSINLNGWSFSNDLKNGRKHVLSDLSVAAGGYAVIWMDQTFGLNPKDDMVFLYDASTNLVDAVHLGPQVADFSAGRVGGEWQVTQPSPGTGNNVATTAAPSGLMINEWYANALAGESDWMEIYNSSSQPVSLRGLIMGNGATSSTIRSLSFVGAGGFVQIYADELPGAAHVRFKLPAANGSIVIQDATGGLINAIEYGIQSEGSSEGRLPDGTANRIFFPRAAITPGASNSSDSDGDGLPDYFELQAGLNPNLATDAGLDIDGDRMNNLQEFMAGTNPTNKMSVLELTTAGGGTDQLQIWFAQQPNHTYSLLYKDSLSQDGWLKASDYAAVQREEALTSYFSVDSKAAPHRFFTVVTPWVRLAGEPLVGATTPVRDSSSNAANGTIQVQFKEPLNAATVSTNSITVQDDLGRSVAGKVTVSDHYTRLLFEPEQVLLADTTYTIGLAGELRSATGELTGLNSYTFRTASSAPMVANPAVYASNNVLYYPDIRITTLPVAGGYTLEDLKNDDDAYDAFDPKVAIHFEQGDYGVGSTNVNGTMQVRGQSTRWTSQKSFKIELTNNAPAWNGQKVLNLNKHPYELTRLRNKFAFDLFKQMSNIISLRTAFAEVEIDGTSFGLFTHVEQPDEDFLAAHDLDEDGYLYKTRFFEFDRYEENIRLKSDPNYNKAAFEEILEIKGHDNHAKLIRMLEDVNDSSIPINEVIKKHFNRENYLTWLAANLLMGNRDTASQNFYLYSPRVTSTWYFIPWDYDGAWGFYSQPDQIAAGTTVSRWTEGIANYWNSTLHRRFIQDPQNWAELQAKVQDLYQNFFTPQRMTGLLESYKPIVEAAVQKEPDYSHLPTVAAEDKLDEWRAEYLRMTNAPTRGLSRFVTGSERPMPVFLGRPEFEPANVRFFWSPSFDLQGDEITYDFEISRTFGFEPENIVASQTGLTTTTTTVPTLPAGNYFWRLIIRDSANPAQNWQVPFDTYYEADYTPHFGMANFVIP